jgi:hypothetical protein
MRRLTLIAVVLVLSVLPVYAGQGGGRGSGGRGGGRGGYGRSVHGRQGNGAYGGFYRYDAHGWRRVDGTGVVTVIGADSIDPDTMSAANAHLRKLKAEAAAKVKAERAAHP